MESAKRCFCLVLGILVPFFDATEASNLKERPNGTSESTEQGIADNVEAGPWEQLQMALQNAQENRDGNSSLQLNRIGLELRWAIAEQGGIPKWDGEKLTNVSVGICRAAELDFDAKRLLAKLNYWEQAYGTTSILPEGRENLARGEEDAAIALYVQQLAERGIHVALDLDEGLWIVIKDDDN